MTILNNCGKISQTYRLITMIGGQIGFWLIVRIRIVVPVVRQTCCKEEEENKYKSQCV